MALRKPLVLNAGQIQQLQSGDTISAPQSGGDVVAQTNDEAGAIAIGTPVYNDANDGVKKAKADASATAKVLGLVADVSITNGVSGQVMVAGLLAATTGQWDTAAGTTGGLTAGTTYYLSGTTAGLLTATAPTTTGQLVVKVGVGISTTEMMINIEQPILL